VEVYIEATHRQAKHASMDRGGNAIQPVATYALV
jgi:hypothetical protein